MAEALGQVGKKKKPSIETFATGETLSLSEKGGKKKGTKVEVPNVSWSPVRIKSSSRVERILNEPGQPLSKT